MILNEDNSDSVNLAVQLLKSNGLVIFPTDTIYGIAADANSDLAIQKIYNLKKRSNKKPIAIFLKNIIEIEKNFILNDLEREIIQKYIPGAITIILKPKNNNKFSKLLNQNNDSVAVRIPNHKFCLKLLNEFNGPIAISSSNVSGQKEINNINLLEKQFNNDVDLMIEGELGKKQIASTIIKIENNEVKILRQGLLNIYS
ncbi:MAG: L-threonylcarbamoyladenylate synthase [Rickettsiales bacterium]|jgi:L-threonylcarbamoyladenylate synthase